MIEDDLPAEDLHAIWEAWLNRNPAFPLWGQQTMLATASGHVFTRDIVADERAFPTIMCERWMCNGVVVQDRIVRVGDEHVDP